MSADAEAQKQLASRLLCVPRILAARNRRQGRRHSAADLADIAQDVALAVWRRLESYQGRASLETWVYRFCTLELMNASRRLGKRPIPMSELDEGQQAESTQESPSLPEADESIERVLRHLSPREAEVVRLRHVEGLDTGECAEAMGISISSVKTHYYRGLEKLRGVLDAEHGETGETT